MPDSSFKTMGTPIVVASPLEWRDMCFSLPAVRALNDAGSEVTILCPEAQEQFWTAAKTGTIISYSEKLSARALAKLLVGIKRALLWEAGMAADACARAGVPEMIGLPAPNLLKHLTMKLERKVVAGHTEHYVQRMLDTVELMGAKPLQGKFFQSIKLDIEHESVSLLVSPDSDFGPNYEWDLDRWASIVEWLQEKDWAPHIGRLQKNGLSSRLAEKTGCELHDIDLSTPTDLARYQLCVSADSSLPHLAGTFGVICAVLFGPADPELTRPLGKQHLIIRKKVECSPCFLSKCPIDLRCQNDLDVKRVIETLMSLSYA